MARKSITLLRLAKGEKAKEKRLSSPSSVKKPAEDVPAQTVAEPTIEYFQTKRATGKGLTNFLILNEAAKKPESQMTSFEKIGMIKEGISKTDLENLKEKADLDYNQLAKVLSVARATLINKKGKEKFDMVLSEKIVSVADIYSYGYEVFEDESRFNNWIFRSNRALGGQSPYDFLDSQYGREEVRNLIGRIDYGVYS
jgi:putative toxin-antitoxin system antitoxin component (TIGR02293 family)